MSIPGATFSEDRRSVTLRMTDNPDVFIRLAVPQIMALVRRLAAVRQEMEPAVPARFTPSGLYRGTGDPAWAVETSSEGAGIVMHLREPGIDWLHYILDPEQAERLGQTLIAAARAGAAPERSRRGADG